MAECTAVSDSPKQFDLDRCVHCGLCLNACPTYRELGVEMDSPRGRIYQMVQVAEGAAVGPSYVEHIDLCLACRACESACPSGVPYGRMVEAARAHIAATVPPTRLQRLARRWLYDRLLPSHLLLTAAGALLWIYQASGMQRLVRGSPFLRLLGKPNSRMRILEQLLPTAEVPFFFGKIGKTFPAEGQRRYRVALLAGCIAGVAFARLNEATVRVLRRNGCEVTVPEGQTCCGALHAHAGLRDTARGLARRNIDAFLQGEWDAVVTNTAGCGAAMKEYHELLAEDPDYAEKARRFSSLVRDATEFLAGIELNREMGKVEAVVTYQDSCHLAHGQGIRGAPRKLLEAVPGLTFREMAQADSCCGSAGVYNVVHTEMAMAILQKKMDHVNATGAGVVATANPGCMLELQAGARLFGHGQRVAHVIEILDQAYAAARAAGSGLQ